VTISFPLSAPASPGFTRFRYVGRNASAATESPFSFFEQVQNHPGDKWMFELTLPKMRRAQAAEWISLRLACRGRLGTFLIGPPDADAPRGSFAGTPVVDGSVAARATALPLRGLTPLTANIARKYDFIQVGSGATTRLHVSLTDVDADSNGDATLDIWPSARETISDGTAVVTSGAKGAFAFATGTAEWDMDQLRNYGVSFVISEALRG
jgi:hypothetical protein